MVAFTVQSRTRLFVYFCSLLWQSRLNHTFIPFLHLFTYTPILILMLAADNASTPQEDYTTVDSANTTGPLQTLNLSLKRIRLNEETQQPITSRTVSIEQEWVSNVNI
jgi:hypothetical protein